MNNLSPRLRAVCDMVPAGARIADIGCDHGYVCIHLSEQGKISSALAMDINEGPLLRAGENIEQYGMSGKIGTRLSDGADRLLPGEADTLIIAGMGARLMCDILKRALSGVAKDDIRCLVLSPHSEAFLVRRFIRENGFVIEDEDFKEDEGKFYPVIRAGRASGVMDDADADDVSVDIMQKEIEDRFGPVLLRKPTEDFVVFLDRECTKLVDIIQKVTDADRKEELQALMKMTEEARRMAGDASKSDNSQT